MMSNNAQVISKLPPRRLYVVIMKGLISSLHAVCCRASILCWRNIYLCHGRAPLYECFPHQGLWSNGSYHPKAGVMTLASLRHGASQTPPCATIALPLCGVLILQYRWIQIMNDLADIMANLLQLGIAHESH